MDNKVITIGGGVLLFIIIAAVLFFMEGGLDGFLKLISQSSP